MTKTEFPITRLQFSFVKVAGSYVISEFTGDSVQFYEPRPEKTGFSHVRKQRHRSASR